MSDLNVKKIEKHCFAVLSGAAQGSDEFLDSPTFWMSKSPLRERLFLLVFLEALIAMENGSEEYFEIDYIMAVNEYLVRRSDLSVRMLNTWIYGQNFRSMQDVTDFFNERYRVTGHFFRDNQLQCRREWLRAAAVYRALYISAVRAQEEIPEELVPYDQKLGDRKYRENPVAFLLTLREEERLRYLALLAETLYEHREAPVRSRKQEPDKACVDFVREFGNLLNTYVKYPEDPEIQTLLLTVRMEMDDEDFKDDLKRRAFFNERLRYAAYLWQTNQRGCRKAVVDRWQEYSIYFKRLPQDTAEPAVPELYLDEAVLNIDEFQNDPLRFLRYQITREQCVHFLTMLHAASRDPENAALAAYLIARWLWEPVTKAGEELDAYFGWEHGSDEERTYNIEQDIWDLVSIWRYNYRNCRKLVKSSWASFEEAYGHVITERVTPDTLSGFEKVLEDQAFVEDPLAMLSGMEEREQLLFIDFCGALHGYDAENAAVFAEAMLTWLENTRNSSARQVMNRIGGWKDTGYAAQIRSIRDFFEKAAVSWKFNYGGFRTAAIERRGEYESELIGSMRAHRGDEYEQEFRSFDSIVEDESFRSHPCEYLRGMTQLQCERFLMFAAALSDMDNESALRFGVLFKNILFYPNDGLRRRVDTALGRRSTDDAQRIEWIEEMLKNSLKDYGTQEEAREELRERWPACAEAFDAYQESEKKNHWELTESNVRRLYRFCSTARESGEPVGETDAGAVAVRLLGTQKPLRVRFKTVYLDGSRIYSDQTGEILRYMLGQLEIIHLRRESNGHRIYTLEMVGRKRDVYGEKSVWTQSGNVICQLLYLAVGAQLLPPILQRENKKTGEVSLVIDLEAPGADKIEPTV